MFEAQYQAESGKWVLLGAGAFKGLAEAWDATIEAVEAAGPAGLLFRIVDLGGDHLDDCSLGIGGDCDCREPLIVAQGRMSRGGEGRPMSMAIMVGQVPVSEPQRVRADGTVIVGWQSGTKG